MIQKAIKMKKREIKTTTTNLTNITIKMTKFDGMWPISKHYTSMFETGYFPNLLQNLLHELGNYVCTLYNTRMVSKPRRVMWSSLPYK
jgi:hypothetical protein